MVESAFPPVPKDLLEALEKRYPERSALPGDVIEDLMFLGGKVDLVRWLRLEYERQTNPQDVDPQEAPAEF